MAEEPMRTMQQQFTSALDSLSRQNVDVQAELARNRQQAAGELEAGFRDSSTRNVDDG